MKPMRFLLVLAPPTPLAGCAMQDGPPPAPPPPPAPAPQTPADRSNYGMFIVLDDLSRTRTRAILEEAARRPGSRIGDFYASFMDEAAVNAAGIAPLRPMLAEIRGISDRSQWARELGRLSG